MRATPEAQKRWAITLVVAALLARGVFLLYRADAAIPKDVPSTFDEMRESDIARCRAANGIPILSAWDSRLANCILLPEKTK